MNQEKYTERMRGFLQSAQMLALREGHQRLVPDHLLKVLLDDPEGLAANLIASSGGDSRAVHRAVEANLAKQPKVEGQGAGQIYITLCVFDSFFCGLLGGVGLFFVQVSAAHCSVGQHGHAIRLDFQNTTGYKHKFFTAVCRVDTHRTWTDTCDQRGVAGIDT